MVNIKYLLAQWFEACKIGFNLNNERDFLNNAFCLKSRLPRTIRDSGEASTYMHAVVCALFFFHNRW